MSDEQIQSYFDDLNASIDHLRGFVTYALDAVSNMKTEVGLLKQMVYSLNNSVNSELMKDKLYDMMVLGKKDDIDGDKQGELLSRLNRKDKMDD